MQQIDKDDIEDQEKLSKVMHDIAQYNRIQEELDQSEKDLTDHNSKILAAVQQSQDGRDDQVNELEKFARDQLEIYR